MIEFVPVFIFFFAVIDPIGTVPVFIAVTKQLDQEMKRRVAIRATLTSAAILVFFVVVGEIILGAMGIPLAAFQIAGGIVLFLFALTMIFGDGKPEQEVKMVRSGSELAVFPLSVPSIARPSIAVRVSELQSQNPRERLPETARTFSHLKELAPGGLPKLHKDVVKHIALQKLCCGTLSLDAVAAELDLGPRTLQRRLSLEGTSFREICNSVIAERAKELLAETDHTVEEIARTLGYDEVNSFRRAFRNHHGTAPSTFRSLEI